MISRLPLVLLCTLTLLGCKMKTDLPRYEEIAPFDPHRPSFTCEIEATKVPPIDAQADAWFQEARALEDPEIWDDDRDYKKIVQLTKQAADRRHWKAMLNLASLYIEGRDPPHGVEDGVRIVEDAMRLGIPAAYDRMGTFHLNGTGVSGGWPRAYAFFQKAADLGSPDAMAYLGKKMTATWDNPKEDFWANLPVALKMLECGFSQGSGMAALELALVYSRGGTTREQRTRALKLLHEGVKLGCGPCAARLSGEFSDPINPAEMLAPHLDTARADRYVELASALRFNPARRFPNLDKVLPLPPAPLPP